MPTTRVRGYTRRDGTRVRSHIRHYGGNDGFDDYCGSYGGEFDCDDDFDDGPFGGGGWACPIPMPYSGPGAYDGWNVPTPPRPEPQIIYV